MLDLRGFVIAPPALAAQWRDSAYPHMRHCFRQDRDLPFNVPHLVQLMGG